MSAFIVEKLFSCRDEAYASFTAGLIPNIAASSIIGVRMPKLRMLAGELSAQERESFLNELPHNYHDENMLHAVLINNMVLPERIFAALDAFLPFVDNWAVCDCLRPHRLKKCLGDLEKYAFDCLDSERTYTVRFGIEMLMSYFLDDYFAPDYPAKISRISSDEYYINMMLAWYFATALAKQWDAVLPYIENRSLAPWVHNKTIQKACESYRISDTHKDYLRTLRMR